jgi:pyroglutamyl-peptidase
MLAGLLDAGIAAEISQTAGTFVCNHVFFGLMHELTRHAGIRGGFVHVPFSPELAKRHGVAPSMPVDAVASALERMIEVALRTTRDRRLGAGATH